MIKIPFGKRLVTVLDDITPREDDRHATIRYKERIQLTNLLKVPCENKKASCTTKNKNG